MREGGAALLSSNIEAVTGGQHNRFETSIEDFYATLDQIELNLKCAAETTGQSQTSGRFMTGGDRLTYQQHISTAKQQVNFTNNVREMLRSSGQTIGEHSASLAQAQPPPPPPQSQCGLLSSPLLVIILSPFPQ